MFKPILRPIFRNILNPVFGSSDELWTLSDTTTLAFYDMDYGITDAGLGKVSTWQDKMNNPLRDISQGTGANRPTLTGNGVEFNGVSEFLFNANPFIYAQSGGVHIMAIISAPANTSGTTGRTLNEASTLNINPNVAYLGKDILVADYGKITQAIRNDANTNILTYGGNTGTSDAWDNTFKLIEHIDTTTQVRTAINCVAEATPITYTRSGTLTLNRFSLGALVRATVLSYSSFTLKGLAIFPATISADDREKAQGFLAHKYNLASLLPVNHPYKNTPPIKTPISNNYIIIAENNYLIAQNGARIIW